MFDKLNTVHSIGRISTKHITQEPHPRLNLNMANRKTAVA